MQRKVLGAELKAKAFHIRDDLGRSMLIVTSRYLHAEDMVRHRETEQSHRLDWMD